MATVVSHTLFSLLHFTPVSMLLQDIVVVGSSFEVVVAETFVHHAADDGSHPNGRQFRKPVLKHKNAR